MNECDQPAGGPGLFKSVEIVAAGEGYGIAVDGKRVKTPGRAPLVVSSRALADAVAEEWRRQTRRVDPDTMPLTRFANSAVDGLRDRREEVIADIVAFADSDCLCYRAEHPSALVAMQSRHWDGPLAWASRRFGVEFIVTRGVMPVAQPDATLAALAMALEQYDDFGLVGLHSLTTLTGSAVLAVAIAEGELSPDAAWQAAHVDEDWQISQWGEDGEAASVRARRRAAFDSAVTFVELATGLER